MRRKAYLTAGEALKQIRTTLGGEPFAVRIQNEALLRTFFPEVMVSVRGEYTADRLRFVLHKDEAQMLATWAGR